jgi:hypothetical protein
MLGYERNRLYNFFFGKDIESHLTAIFVACKTTQGLDILVPKVKTYSDNSLCSLQTDATTQGLDIEVPKVKTCFEKSLYSLQNDATTQGLLHSETCGQDSKN